VAAGARPARLPWILRRLWGTTDPDTRCSRRSDALDADTVQQKLHTERGDYWVCSVTGQLEREREAIDLAALYDAAWSSRAVVPEPTPSQRRLIAGQRNGPPKGCGGVRGYARCVAISRGDLHTSTDLIRAEIIGDWDPDAFDLETAQVAFAR